MQAGIGRITARLAEPSDRISSELIRLINTNINPPTHVEKNDVYVRAMYVVSDEVNSFGGRFPVEEYETLCSLLIDSPVMVGHRKDKLPIGRNFHAVIIEKDNRRWIKSYFYWLRKSHGAETLKDNIDGGIYKECSIGFSFLLPECSVCGKDIRTCDHEPFQSYDDSRCYFNYRRIERVLETSLVYRGAVPDTSISKELKNTEENQDPDNSDPARKESPRKTQSRVAAGLDPADRATVASQSAEEPRACHCEESSLPDDEAISTTTGEADDKYTADVQASRSSSSTGTETEIDSLLQLNLNRRYVVAPYYEGLPATVSFGDRGLIVRLHGRHPLDKLILTQFDTADLPEFDDTFAYLIGFRGKERCSVTSIEKYLQGKASPVSRFELHVFSDDIPEFNRPAPGRKRHRVRQMRRRDADIVDLPGVAKKMTTRDGVRLWVAGQLGPDMPAWKYRANCETDMVESVYSLLRDTQHGPTLFSLTVDGVVRRFSLSQFDVSRLQKGSRFVADPSDSSDINFNQDTLTAAGGLIASAIQRGDGLLLQLTGALTGRFTLQPITMNGRNRFLFSRCERKCFR